MDEDDMDFKEGAESAVDKRKLLINRVMEKTLLPDEPDNDEEEDEREEVEAAVPYVTLIRKCDCTIKLIICKLPHKMDCSNKSLESDKKAVSKSAKKISHKEQGTDQS